jgi:acyl-CoA synthetase (NDP forming)
MEQQAESHPLERLIRPRSVAIVGASSDPSRTAGRPLGYLLKHGYRGMVYPVNPRADEIQGVKAYPSIEALPEAPDCGLILVGPDRVTEAVRELARIGTSTAIVLAGGYAEVSADGARRQAELKEAAGAMRLLGPNTIGLVNVIDGTALSPSVALELAPLTPGKVGLASQSGGILGSVLSRAEARGIGFSRLVGTGNEADLEIADIVEYLLDDDATSVIALYLEGLRNVPRFRELAARAQQIGKPMVAFKVGRSEVGARSASSHTGAMAGSDRVYDALFEQYGVIRAGTFSDLLDISGTLAAGRKLGGKRLAVLTSTGGAGVLVADACGALGFEAPPPEPETVQRLTRALTGDAEMAERNPVDVTLAGLSSDIFRSAISTLLASPSYDALVVIVGSSGLARPELAGGPVLESLAESPKPLVVYVSPGAPSIVQYLNRNGVPAFESPEGCAAGLGALARVSLRESPTPGPAKGNEAEGAMNRTPTAPSNNEVGAQFIAPTSPQFIAPTLPSPLHHLGSLANYSGRLNESEAARLFARFGIRSVHERPVQSATAATEAARTIAGPDGRVVLKVLSRDLAHKSETGGVLVGVPVHEATMRGGDLLATVRERAPQAAIEGLLVQELVEGGVETILGFIRDPQVGPAILVGAGGAAAEIYEDVVLRLPPISRPEAVAMIERLRCYPLLAGFRGRPPGDLDALADAIVAFSGMVLELGDRLEEAEINPLFVLPAGQGVVAADGLAVLR